MQIVNNIVGLRETVAVYKATGHSIAFVPTMGNLHAGHLKLVEVAKQSADRVVVSIFVNPTQFGLGEDFEAYPRTETQDQEKLLRAGVDVLFLPSVTEIYGDNSKTVVNVKQLSDLHCGVSRPGHFDGVATVVCKLFNMVQPNVALLGQKDFQQLAIIRTMVHDLNIPIEIKAVPTVREQSGLAMSSRNGYLTLEQLQIAPKLYETLCTAREEMILGKKSVEVIEYDAKAYLQNVGFIPDYFNISRTNDLLKATHQDTNLVILAAAKLGSTRLIDNLCFTVVR